MPMTLSGDGTITGLVAGGLPNATVIDADLSLTANSAQVMVALNASGSAPIYACRAWVNFNGQGTPAIRASGNVSSITDNGTGRFTVNLTTAMSDANYAVIVSAIRRVFINTSDSGISASSFTVASDDSLGTAADVSQYYAAVFR
jgi:hypothetical protein